MTPVSSDALLDAGLVVLNRHPTGTMAEIARSIGVSRATLHRHFSSRDALLAAIAERALDRWRRTQDEMQIDAAAASGDPATIDRALRGLLRQYVADAEDFSLALTDHLTIALPELAERIEALTDREATFYAAAQQAGVLRADLPARWVGDVVNGLMVSVREARRVGNVAPRDLSELVVSTFMSGAGR